MSEPTHHCDFCNRDIIPDELEDEFGLTGQVMCPHCGATSYDYQHEFGINEPWVKPLKEKDAEERVSGE